LATGIPARLTAAEGRRFGLTVGAAFLALGAVAAWRGRPHTALAFGGVGTVLVLAGVVIPGRLGPVFRGWMGLAHLLSKVTTPIFLGVVYFGVFTPVGLVMRLCGRRPLDSKVPAGAASRWIARAADARQRSDMQRQF
jgi:hypothetical protein